MKTVERSGSSSWTTNDAASNRRSSGQDLWFCINFFSCCAATVIKEWSTKGLAKESLRAATLVLLDLEAA
jgi:hypothetical protein